MTDIDSIKPAFYLNEAVRLPGMVGVAATVPYYDKDAILAAFQMGQDSMRTKPLPEPEIDHDIPPFV